MAEGAVGDLVGGSVEERGGSGGFGWAGIFGNCVEVLEVAINDCHQGRLLAVYNGVKVSGRGNGLGGCWGGRGGGLTGEGY